MIGALAALESVFPPVPADTAVALGAFLSNGGPVTASGVFLVTWVCNVSSAIGVYFVTRRVGRPFFRGPIGRRLLKPAALTKIEHLYRRYGTWGIFLSRFVPGARAVVPPFAGVAGLPAVRAVIPLVVASGIWYGALTWAAATFIREVDEIAEFIGRLNRSGLIALGALSVLVVIVLVIRWRKKRLAPTK